MPGECPSKAHDREHLGLGGRRVLVSRQWTGKTLTEHRADRSEVVRQTLAAAGVEMDDQNELATHTDNPEAPRFIWQPIRPGEERSLRRIPTHKEVLAEAIATRIRWRTQYEQASPARVHVLFEKQRRRCAICLAPVKLGATNHERGDCEHLDAHVRGVLRRRCNSAVRKNADEWTPFIRFYNVLPRWRSYVYDPPALRLLGAPLLHGRRADTISQLEFARLLAL